jgi:Fe-S-cluster-containing dehydrogenase component
MEEEDLIKPIVCRQCVNPLCMQNCPAKAINRDAKTGIVNINESLCLGCRACVDACPFGAISIDPKTSKPIKCDLCGGEPACIKVCSKKAVTYERVDVSPRLKMQAMTAKLTGKKVK